MQQQQHPLHQLPSHEYKRRSSISATKRRKVYEQRCASFDMLDLLKATKPVEQAMVFPNIEWTFDEGDDHDNDNENHTTDTLKSTNNSSSHHHHQHTYVKSNETDLRGSEHDALSQNSRYRELCGNQDGSLHALVGKVNACVQDSDAEEDEGSRYYAEEQGFGRSRSAHTLGKRTRGDDDDDDSGDNEEDRGVTYRHSINTRRSRHKGLSRSSQKASCLQSLLASTPRNNKLSSMDSLPKLQPLRLGMIDIAPLDFPYPPQKQRQQAFA